eukprot:maker-scaffold2688_size13239-snap-gene-0.3 protein:Tk10225 transcript:maker-scaffold2688_size13239-snap-gene-0.3-mRNA-1 annotation:"chymotrypsin-like serine proteinase"
MLGGKVRRADLKDFHVVVDGVTVLREKERKMKLLVLIASIALATASVIPEDKVYRSRAALYPRVRLPEHLSFGKIVGGNEAEPHSHPFIAISVIPKDEVYPSRATLLDSASLSDLRSLGKIAGGQEAEPHSHPFIVSLKFDEAWMCQGVLWRSDVVVTAASCTKGKSSAKVIAGAHDRTEDEFSQQYQISTDFRTHPEYSGSFSNNNDLALIILPRSFETNEFISTIKLATSEPSVGNPIQTAGWGARGNSPSAYPSDVLIDVSLNVTDDALASDAYDPEVDFSTKICADTSSVTAVTCRGDKGDPLFIGDGRNSTLVGIATLVASSGCNIGVPTCFTSVSYYLDWIADNSE